MTKLKTLKDLTTGNIGSPSFNKPWLVEAEKLKQEAIKHVKANEKEETDTPEELIFKSGYCQGLIDFHNITEEDLK